jgi:hypothetical protein
MSEQFKLCEARSGKPVVRLNFYKLRRGASAIQNALALPQKDLTCSVTGPGFISQKGATGGTFLDQDM